MKTLFLDKKQNTKLSFLVFILSLSMGLQFSSCEKDRKSSVPTGPTGSLEPNALTNVLVVPSAQVIEGNMPAPTNTPESPEMLMVDSTVSYTAGSYVRLPIDFTDNSGTGISGIQFQVNGADSYIDVPVIAGSSGTMLLPIGIPANTEEGNFCITIAIYDNDNNVSNNFETCVTVTQPMGCDVTRVSGGEGITSTLHNMGSNPGVVKIEYETFTVPDRIDVFYNGVWVAGTGSNPGPIGAIPPLANCSNPTEGYIGDDGTFCFTYDPDNYKNTVLKNGKLKSLNLESHLLNLQDTLHYVEVVVSGCVRGGTLWEYTISCADPDEECSLGQEGSPRINLQFDGDVDFDLHVIDPDGEEIYFGNSTSSSGGTLDVDCICCDHGNENIYWISGTAPNGNYEYWVKFYGDCSDQNSNFTITITNNGNVVSTQTGNLSSVGSESQHWFYTHPSQGGGNNTPPSASFSSNVVTGNMPLTVNFTDQSTNNPTSWLWQFGDGTTSTEQNPTHTFTEAGNYTIQLQVSNTFGSDSETKNNYITVTSNGGGGGEGEPCPGIPNINYEGQTYNTVQIGNQCWLKENLNVGTMITANIYNNQTNNGQIEKYCYENNASNCNTYGGLYQWDEMMQYTNQQGTKGICPPGWHIPSKVEWEELINYLGGTSFAGGKLKESGTNHWNSPNSSFATNESGFTALPGGFFNFYGDFLDVNYYAYFWTSTEENGSARYYHLSYSTTSIGTAYYNKILGRSVRCIKD